MRAHVPVAVFNADLVEDGLVDVAVNQPHAGAEPEPVGAEAEIQIRQGVA